MSSNVDVEMVVCQQLQNYLNPGETLVASTRGEIMGLVTMQPVCLGLTPQRFILMFLKGDKPSGRVNNLWRENVQSVEWSNLWSSVKIVLAQDSLDIQSSSAAKENARKLVDAYGKHSSAGIPADPALAEQRRVQQARDLQDLGMVASAQQLLEKAPEVGASEERQEVITSLSDRRMAVRMAAAFMFLNVGLVALLTVLVVVGMQRGIPAFWIWVAAVVDFVVGINLWQGHGRRWEMAAVLRAVVGFILLGLLALPRGAWLDFVMQASLSGALVLVLTGQSSRTRTWLAAAVYIIGYVGLLAVSLIAGMLQGSGLI